MAYERKDAYHQRAKREGFRSRAAYKLAEYGDVIAVRTRLGGLLVGTVLLAAATSLPELLASVSAFRQGVPNLAAGNFFGSNMVNVLMLAVVDLLTTRVPLLRRVAVGHALTATLASTLMIVAAIFVIVLVWRLLRDKWRADEQKYYG